MAGFRMTRKNKGQLTMSGEWARHLRPLLRRVFWKGERQAEKGLIRAEAGTVNPLTDLQYQLIDAFPSDLVWLENLRRNVYQELFQATWGGWDEARHVRHFAECVERAHISIIEMDGVRVGMVQRFDAPGCVEMGEIQVQPIHQNRGVGTRVLSDIISDARQRGKTVRLSVGLKNHKAYRLYERLGFRRVAQSDTHNHMEWPVAPLNSTVSLATESDVQVDEKACEAVWLEYLRSLPPGHAHHRVKPDAFAFGGSKALADSLGQLVIDGKKRATTSLAVEFTSLNEPLPTVGSMSIVVDGNGSPMAIIERTDVREMQFQFVDEAFAATEGEGDGSLDHWRKAHTEYFTSVCARLGGEFSATTPVLCQIFEVRWRVPFRQPGPSDVGSHA